MIAIDTQILVYAHRSEVPWHVAARDKIAGLANGGIRWAIPLHCLVEFYATVTNRRLFRPASSPTQAIDQIDAWLEAPSVAALAEDVQTWPIAKDLLVAASIVGNHAYDARIAAVCLQHGVTELWTNDRDFLRFPALRVHNPLIDIPPTRAGERRAVYRHRRPHGGSSSARAVSRRPDR